MQHVNIHSGLIIAYSELHDGNIDSRFEGKEEVKKHRHQIFEALKISSSQVIEGEQIHFNRILTLTKDNAKMWHGQKITGVDGFVTNTNEIALMLRLADCLPLVLYDAKHRVVALIHAGWRGVDNGIHTLAVERMQAAYKSEPSDLLVWMGPSAKVCCYRHETLPEALLQPKWKPFLHKKGAYTAVDLVDFVTTDLKSHGLLKKNMKIDSRCTIEDKNLFSHQRSEKQGEPEGRFAVIVKLR